LKTNYRSSRRAVFNLTVHIVLVTKYRRKVINADMGAELKRVFESVLASWDSELIELIVSKTYYKRVFWTGAYFVASCGGVTIDVLKKYVQQQDCPDSSHQHS
jgi:putative transposase